MNRIISCENDNNTTGKSYYLPKTMYILFLIMFGLSMLGESDIFCALRAKKETLKNNRFMYYLIKYRVIIIYAVFIIIGMFSSGLTSLKCKGGLLKNPDWANNYLRFMKLSAWFHLLMGHFKSSSIFLFLLYATLPSCVKKKCADVTEDVGDVGDVGDKDEKCDNTEYDYVYGKMNLLFIIHACIWLFLIIKMIIKKVS